jgi:hypothetical protein
MMQKNENTGITDAIPDFLVKTPICRYNIRIKPAKTLAKSMNVHQKHLANNQKRTPTRLQEVPFSTYFCTKTSIGRLLSLSEVFIPFF